MTTVPGATTFTRILRSRRSTDQVRANDLTAAFVAAYTPNAGTPFSETIDPFRTIDAFWWTAVELQAAELVHFRDFAGQAMSASAELLGLSLRSTHRLWAYAKAWLLQEFEWD